ncbi:hypothetical protein NDU88_004846 [Pleurodeles waltl]|uniref:Uncharacterized protein n=1 Tax=Pleurodeles waltl TaxID=8319 RepID=A0AAV7WWL4_PLEWA|nr:hypothetical protein NDU88_004846 [Pleurodeles waltl]
MSTPQVQPNSSLTQCKKAVELEKEEMLGARGYVHRVFKFSKDIAAAQVGPGLEKSNGQGSAQKNRNSALPAGSGVLILLLASLGCSFE